MISLIPFIVFTIIFLCASVFFRRSFAFITPVTLVCIILLQYTLGLFFHLSVAFYATIILAFVCLVWLTIRIVRNGFDDLRTYALTPGFLAYIIMIGIILALSHGRVCYITDEYSHWGTVVKNMLYFDQFGSIAQSTTAYKTYPPCGSLLPYFFAKFDPTFRESSMYHGALLLTFSLLLPLFEHIRKRDWQRFLLVGGLSFFAPLTFFSYAYASLYVDVQVALVFGNLLTQYFTNDYTNQSKGHWIIIGLYSGFIALLKPSGTGFAVLALLLYLAYQAVTTRGKQMRFKETPSRRSLIPFIGIAIFVFCIASWQINLLICGAKSVFTLHGSSDGGMLTQLSHLSAGQRSSIQRFIIRHLTMEENGKISLSIANWIIALLGLGLLVRQIQQKFSASQDKSRINPIWFLIVGYSVYAGALLFSYLFVFTQGEADYLASFDRYVFTYFLGIFLYLIWHLARQSDQHSQRISYVVLFLIIYISMTPFLPYISPGISQQARAELGRMSSVAESLNPTTDSIGLVSSDGIRTRAFTYLVTPVKSMLFWKAADSGEPADVWAKKVKDSCKYLYVDSTTPFFRSTYASLFPSGIEDETLYRVAVTGSEVEFQKVSP